MVHILYSPLTTDMNEHVVYVIGSLYGVVISVCNESLSCLDRFVKFASIVIRCLFETIVNVRRNNQEWTFQRHKQNWAHKTQDQDKQSTTQKTKKMRNTIWQCCLTSSFNLSSPLYHTVNIKENSEDIRTNAHMVQFWYISKSRKFPY